MSLITKYRPKKLSHVVGHAAVKESLRSALGEDVPAFLLSGPSGVGKTTLARIIGSELGCKSSLDFKEYDAATRTGVDDVRLLLEELRYSIGAGRSRVICLDEAHMLSKNAWNALLKAIEEPAKGVHWVFCTTELNKVPKTIKTRCLDLVLDPVSDSDLSKLLEYVLKSEEVEVEDLVFDKLLDYADGSPRRMLSGLESVVGLSPDQADALLRSSSDQPGAIELCRALSKGCTWKAATEIIKGISPLNPEGVRMVVCSYFSKVAMSSNASRARSALSVLEAFEEPYSTSQPHHLLLSLGFLLNE